MYYNEIKFQDQTIPLLCAVEDHFHRWKVLANLFLKPVGGRGIFHSNLSSSKLTKQRIEQLPLFYVDAINLFIQFAKVEDLSSNDIMPQHLLDNACILRQNSPIYDPYLSSKGIKTLKDVIDDKGNNKKQEYMFTFCLDLLTFCLGMGY